MNFYFDWSDATILRLRDLWAEGHSSAEIGRRLGCSKNVVIGKAHRIKLPSRPSPINLRGAEHPNWKPRGAGTAPRFRRERGALAIIRELRTLEPRAEYKPPKLGVLMADVMQPADYLAPIDPILSRQLYEAKRLAPRPALTPGAHVGAAKSCQFPSWRDDEKPTHVYCDAPVERDESGAPTGSYCGACRQRCYTRTRRQEWAA